VNAYIAKVGGGFILFDTGGHLVMDKEFTNRREPLINALERAGVREGKLRLIVLTHGDNDHVCNAAYIRERYDSKIAMHPDDVYLVKNPRLENLMESFHYRSFVYKVVMKFMNKTITAVMQRTLDEFEAFSPDILIEDGFDLSEYGLNAKIIHLPGHTKGSVGVLTDNGDLIAGDTLANSWKPSAAINACDFKELASSVGKLRGLSVKNVYPGHGEAFVFREYVALEVNK